VQPACIAFVDTPARHDVPSTITVPRFVPLHHLVGFPRPLQGVPRGDGVQAAALRQPASDLDLRPPARFRGGGRQPDEPEGDALAHELVERERRFRLPARGAVIWRSYQTAFTKGRRDDGGAARTDARSGAEATRSTVPRSGNAKP
jgi:hypothetical protein